MGNCQAVDTASLVIQHPARKPEKLFWPISATQVMKSNPGYSVALLITTTTTTTTATSGVKGTLRIPRVKLLRPTDTLTLGHVYRLISTQEVMKGLLAKKQAKMLNMKQEDGSGLPEKALVRRVEPNPQKSNQGTQRQRSSASANSSRSKSWQPSLNSISESQS